MNRRALWGFLAVSPMAAAGAVSASTRQSDAPTDAPFLTLDADKNELLLETAHRPGQGVAIRAGGRITERGGSVTMSIGKDGALWIKSREGRWARVVTE